MTDEDRKTALGLYDKLFDECADEEQVLAKLVSPTRQAVNIARNYDAAQRKAALEAGGDEEGEKPVFVEVIEKICGNVLESVGGSVKPPVEEPEPEEVPVEEETVPPAEEEPAEKVTGDEILDDLPGDLDPRVAEAVAALARAVDSASRETGSMDKIIEKTRDIYEDETPAPAAPAAPDTDKVPVKAEAVEAGEITGSTIDDIDAFLDSILVNDEISAAETPLTEDKPLIDDAVAADAEVTAEEAPAQAEENTEPQKKTKIPMLIFFILVGVPVCAALILLILAVALSLAGLAALDFMAAFSAISTAFGAYSVFANILVVIGASLVIIALALLLLWAAVWLVGGLAVKLVKNAISLAGKMCYEEAHA